MASTSTRAHAAVTELPMLGLHLAALCGHVAIGGNRARVTPISFRARITRWLPRRTINLLTRPTKLRPRVQSRSPSGTARQARHPSSPTSGGVYDQALSSLLKHQGQYGRPVLQRVHEVAAGEPLLLYPPSNDIVLLQTDGLELRGCDAITPWRSGTTRAEGNAYGCVDLE
jgi:hypothetical protein